MNALVVLRRDELSNLPSNVLSSFGQFQVLKNRTVKSGYLISWFH